MPVPTETLTVALRGVEHALEVLSLPDRRKRGAKQKAWVLVRAVEKLLYDVQARSTGRFADHLARMSMADGVLVAERRTVDAGTLLEDELAAGAPAAGERGRGGGHVCTVATDCALAHPPAAHALLAVLAAMKPLVDVEARARVRKASICPLTILVAALTEYGRCDATTAILTACNKLPTRWAKEIESEANAANNEVDLVLEMELHESEDCDEHADLDLAHELLMTVLPYDAADDDTAKVSNSALDPVPQRVADQLAAYEQHRMAPFNRHRTGAQVVTLTVESDKSNALRWLGYVKAHHGQEPRLELFAHPAVGEWTQAWMEWLRAQGLKSSTLAVYCNQVLAVSGYALTLVHDPSACPTEELLNLRKQAESLAKQARARGGC